MKQGHPGTKRKARALLGGAAGRAGGGCARRADAGANSATVTMSLCAWKHSYALLFSCGAGTVAVD